MSRAEGGAFKAPEITPGLAHAKGMDGLSDGFNGLGRPAVHQDPLALARPAACGCDPVRSGQGSPLLPDVLPGEGALFFPFRCFDLVEKYRFLRRVPRGFPGLLHGPLTALLPTP